MAGILSFIPLILLFMFVGGFAWVGYQMYIYTSQLSERAQNHMEKKHNISYTKDGGMRVGVKEVSAEEYAGQTQNILVKTWNESQWPDYKSRLWNKEAQKNKAHTSSSSAGKSK